jgi:hypothetical protein
MATVKIRLIQGVSGLDFAWAPGEVIELPADEAAKWADGERAEYAGEQADRPDHADSGELAGDVEPPRGDEADLPAAPPEPQSTAEPKPQKAAPRRPNRRRQ